MADAEQPPVQVRRRRRPAVTCTLCRRRKIRCDREKPCGNCVRSRTGDCVYAEPTYPTPLSMGPPSRVAREISQGSSASEASGLLSSSQASTVAAAHPQAMAFQVASLGSASTHTPSSASVPSPSDQRDPESLRRTISKLERRLAVMSQSSSSPSGTSASGLSLHHEVTAAMDAAAATPRFTVVGARLGPRPNHPEYMKYMKFHELRRKDHDSIVRSVQHKTRLFGQTHWMNVVAMHKDIYMLEPAFRDNCSKVFTDMQRCKVLAKKIKNQRMPAWPTPPTTDLPPKATADALVECYLRTSETVYRILHIPTFRRDYEAVWSTAARPSSPASLAMPPPATTPPGPGFLVLLKLVLAIGATTFDPHFSMRTAAIRWVCEAQCWLASPNFKSQLGMQSLQTHVLLLLAREAVDISSDSVWVSAGDLLRRAVHMGMHRDPRGHLQLSSTWGSGGTVFATEMRRRLWNTILEIALQTSLACGAPPLLSLDDFDVEPPGNYDDDQLLVLSVAEGEGSHVQRPDDRKLTQTSVARALRRTFSARLAVVKFLNGINSCGSYEETLRLDSELRASYKSLRDILHSRGSGGGATEQGGFSVPQFALRMVDFLMHSYLIALHVPFMEQALQGGPTFAFSRMVVSETSLKIWRSARPAWPRPTADPTTATAMITPAGQQDIIFTYGDNEDDDFARFVLCGHGFNRVTATQAALLISLELRTQLLESYSLCGDGGVVGGPTSSSSSSGSRPVPRPDLLSAVEDAREWSLACVADGDTNVKCYVLMCAVAAQIDCLVKGLDREETGRALVKASEDAADRSLPILEAMAAMPCAINERADHNMMAAAAFDTPPGMGEEWDFLVADSMLNSGGMGGDWSNYWNIDPGPGNAPTVTTGAPL